MFRFFFPHLRRVTDKERFEFDNLERETNFSRAETKIFIISRLIIFHLTKILATDSINIVIKLLRRPLFTTCHDDIFL